MTEMYKTQNEKSAFVEDENADVVLRNAQLTLYMVPADMIAQYPVVSRAEAVNYMFRLGDEGQVLVKGAGDKFYLVPADDARKFKLPENEALRIGQIGENFREKLAAADSQKQVASILTRTPANDLVQLKGGLLPNLPVLCQCGPAPGRNFIAGLTVG